MKVIGHQYSVLLHYFSQRIEIRGRGTLRDSLYRLYHSSGSDISSIGLIVLGWKSDDSSFRASHRGLYIVDRMESRSYGSKTESLDEALYRDRVAPIKCSLGLHTCGKRLTHLMNWSSNASLSTRSNPASFSFLCLGIIVFDYQKHESRPILWMESN